MAFTGFADPDAKFFKALAKHQDRDWFARHKGEFEEGWNAPMKALLADVRDQIDAAFAHVELDDPKVFRIFRDVRFSKDKAPYKTHVGGLVPVKRTGKTTEVPIALYLQIGVPETFAAAGHYMMAPDALARFRAAVADDARGRELDRLLAALGKKGYSVSSHDSYKRVPAGFDSEHPRAEHLKRKGLHVTFPAIPRALLTSPKLVTHLAKQVRAAAPLVEWLVFATA